MANFLEKLLSTQKTSQLAKTNELGKIQSLGDNLIVVPRSNEHPEYLIASGRILHQGKHVNDVRTAINKKGNDVEFSTNLGKLPNTSLGVEIKDSLSHRLDGKFVTFNNQEEPSTVDLVYATRKPYDWLNKERLEHELKNHAMTKDLVNPVLSASKNLGQPKKNLNYSSIREIAQDIVDSNLGLHERISNKLATSQYLPNPTKNKKG